MSELSALQEQAFFALTRLTARSRFPSPRDSRFAPLQGGGIVDDGFEPPENPLLPTINS